MEPPLLLRACVCKAACDRRDILRCFAFDQRSHVFIRQRPVVDAHLVQVAPAIVAVGAFDAGGSNDARVRPELIQRGIEHARGGLFGHHLAVDVKADACGLIPCQRQKRPLIRLGKVRHVVGDARPAQVHVGDKSIEPMAVVIDAQPCLVPTGMVRVAHAEDGKRRLVHRVARTPIERERAALRIDVARRPVGKQLIVAALNVGAARAAGNESSRRARSWGRDRRRLRSRR